MADTLRSSKVWLWLSIIVALNCMAAQAATWTPVGPEGGNIAVFAIDPKNPSVIYAGTRYGSGIFKSTDGGTHWVAAGAGLITSKVYSLAINPQDTSILYIGTSEEGLFKSTDGGTHWQASGLAAITVNAIVIDATLPTTMYAGINCGGVFKSIDGGNNWTPTSLSDESVHSLAADPQRPSTLYAGTVDNALYKSIDQGATWQPIYLFPGSGGIKTLAIDPQTPTILYAGLLTKSSPYLGTLYKSTDGGQSWNKADIGMWPEMQIYSLAIDPQTPTTLYAAGTSDC